MKARPVKEETPTVQGEVEKARDEAEQGLQPPEGPVDLLPIQLRVKRQFKRLGKDVGPPDYDEEVLLVEDFHVPPAEVGVRKSQTLNLGNYESAQIEVSIRVPCYREEASEAYEFSKNFVEERLVKEREGIKEWAQKRSVTHLF